jgi:uncharacterized protein (DUF433 family)
VTEGEPGWSLAIIVRDERIQSGTPRIDGTRVTVLDCKRRVIDKEGAPHVVAGEYGLSMAELVTQDCVGV